MGRVPAVISVCKVPHHVRSRPLCALAACHRAAPYESMPQAQLTVDDVGLVVSLGVFLSLCVLRGSSSDARPPQDVELVLPLSCAEGAHS